MVVAVIALDGRYLAAESIVHFAAQSPGMDPGTLALSKAADAFISISTILGGGLIFALRAALVPSPPWRTLVLTALLGLPLVVVPFFFAPAAAGVAGAADRELPRGGRRHLRDLVGDRDGGDHRDLARRVRAARRGAAGPAPRAVHDRVEDRRGRDGRRLPRAPRDDEAPHRGQAAPTGEGHRGQPQAVRAGGPADRPPHPPAHDHDLRLRPHAGGRLLLRHGAPGRGVAGEGGPGGRTAGAGESDPRALRGGGRSRRGARDGPHPPRHQAREHHPVPPGGPLRLPEGGGLRAGQGPRARWQRGPDPGRRDRGDAALHRPGGHHLARVGGPAVRPLLARGGRLLRAHRAARLPGSHPGRGLLTPPPHEAAAAFEAPRRAGAGRPRGAGARLPREGPRPTTGRRPRAAPPARGLRGVRRLDRRGRPRVVGAERRGHRADPVTALDGELTLSRRLSPIDGEAS